MNVWYWLESGRCDYALNMALDEVLMNTAPELGAPVLRFYGWQQPAASFGYFQRIAEIERTTHLRPLVRRPTGGGLVPHDADWTYSLAFPPAHEWYQLRAEQSYERVHQWLQAAFGHLGIATELAPQARKDLPGQCFVGYEKHDLLQGGRKLAGAAQRRTKHGLLIQGSLQPFSRATPRAAWEQAMLQAAVKNWAVAWQPLPAPETLLTQAQTLAAEKYAREEFNRGR